METVKQEATTPTAGEQQPTGRTFTQDEVNTIISDRLNRERTKYADYDDLKAKASQADSLQAQLDSLNKANTLREMRGKVSAATGVPADLLTGETEEECAEQANKIKQYASPSYPVVKCAPPLHLPTIGDGSAADAFARGRKHKPKEFRSY